MKTIKQILENLDYILNKHSLDEMARPKSFVENKIKEQGDEFIYHCIKMLLWKDLSTDWYKTIWSTCNVAQKYTLASTGKPATDAQIKRWLVQDVLKEYQGFAHMINMTIEENIYKDSRPYPKPEEYKYSEVLNKFNTFVDVISKDLSQQKLTFNKCCEYCNNYLIG